MMKCLITHDTWTGFLRSRWMAVWSVSWISRSISRKVPLVPIGKKDGCAPDPTWRLLRHEESPWHETESRYPLNKRLGGSQTLSGCCGNSFFASAESLLSISRSSTLHPFQLDLPISIPYFEYLTMVYANTEALQPDGTSRNLKLSRGEEKPQFMVYYVMTMHWLSRVAYCQTAEWTFS